MRLRRKSEGPAPVRRILVGTDRSETATRAVRWAAQMAAVYGAELIVCQSVRDGMDKLSTQRDLAEYAKEIVGPEARALAAQGNDPARVMVELAKEEDVDVIVVGHSSLQDDFDPLTEAEVVQVMEEELGVPR